MRLFGLIAAFVLALAACAIGTSDSPQQGESSLAPDITTIRFGDLGIVGNAAVYAALEAGYFRANHIDLELIPFRSAVFMMPFMSQGKLDAGAGTPSAALYNAIGAGAEIRIVADSARVASGPNSHIALVLGKDAARVTHTYSELSGLRLAINAPAGGVEVQLARALERGGLDLNDVTVVHVPFPEMIAALASGAIDGAIIPEPFLTLGLEQGAFVEFASVGEFYPDHQVSVMFFSQQLAEDRDLSLRFLEAYLKGVRDYREALLLDLRDPAIVAAAVIKHIPLDDPAMLFEMRHHEIDENGLVNLASIASDLEYFYEAGYVDRIPDLTTIVDTELVRSLMLDES